MTMKRTMSTRAVPSTGAGADAGVGTGDEGPAHGRSTAIRAVTATLAVAVIGGAIYYLEWGTAREAVRSAAQQLL